MPRRESIAARVLFEMLETQRLGLGDQQSQHPSPRGAVADYLFFGLAEPDGDELLEPSTSGIEHAECGIAGADEGLGLFD